VVRRARFDDMVEVARSEGIEGGSLSGVLFDLGVSSPQLDRPERGFSFRNDGPLNMRMGGDSDGGPTAAEVINSIDPDGLRRLLVDNGEGRNAARLARAIVRARPFETTGQLASVVDQATPARNRRRGHPATRVFQALRIVVNDELVQLKDVLPRAISELQPEGRCVAIAYHSSEDRIVKAAFHEAETGGCACPPGLPCACGAVPIGRLQRRGAIKPSEAESARNPRAQSARLRVLVRVGVDTSPGGGL
jgi:16S rRNA (cytosine1402-N4)-methyltransferase